MENKNSQRKIIKDRLNGLSVEERKRCSSVICEYLRNLISEENVLSYYPFNKEVDISAFNRNKSVAYPLITGEHDMEFYVPNSSSYNLNRYGIYEPDINNSRKADANDYHYIIVPLVGFDEKLYRLGHGKAYYDNYLNGKNLIKVGAAYEIQKLNQIVHEEHDIPLDYIITEKGIYKKESI